MKEVENTGWAVMRIADGSERLKNVQNESLVWDMVEKRYRYRPGDKAKAGQRIYLRRGRGGWTTNPQLIRLFNRKCDASNTYVAQTGRGEALRVSLSIKRIVEVEAEL